MHVTQKPKALIQSINEFASWVADAEKGDACIYAANTQQLFDVSDERDRIARAAWRYSESGLVNLVQKRVTPSTARGGGSFDYIAQRTGRVA